MKILKRTLCENIKQHPFSWQQCLSPKWRVWAAFGVGFSQGISRFRTRTVKEKEQIFLWKKMTESWKFFCLAIWQPKTVYKIGNSCHRFLPPIFSVFLPWRSLNINSQVSYICILTYQTSADWCKTFLIFNPRHYRQAYSLLGEIKTTDMNILEIKVVAGFINYKVCVFSYFRTLINIYLVYTIVIIVT